MELLDAVKKLNNLKDDAEKIDNWIAELRFGKEERQCPVIGRSRAKIERAINDVLHELLDEHAELENKVKEATKDISI